MLISGIKYFERLQARDPTTSKSQTPRVSAAVTGKNAADINQVRSKRCATVELYPYWLEGSFISVNNDRGKSPEWYLSCKLRVVANWPFHTRAKNAEDWSTMGTCSQMSRERLCCFGQRGYIFVGKKSAIRIPCNNVMLAAAVTNSISSSSTNLLFHLIWFLIQFETTESPDADAGERRE